MSTEQSPPSRTIEIAIIALALLMGLYHLVYFRTIFQDPIAHQNTHLGLALLLVFLVTLQRRRRGLEPSMEVKEGGNYHG